MRQRCVRQTVVWLALTGAPLACSGTKQVAVIPAGGAAGQGGHAEPLAPAAAGAASGSGGANSDATPDTSGSAGALPGGGIPVCESPRVEASSQLVVCANGFVHRAKPAVCGSGAAGSGGAAPDDAPSTAGAPDERAAYTTSCTDDSDCPSGSACVCDGAAFLFNLPPSENAQGLCVLAMCKTDADCPPHSYCAVGNLDFLGEADPGFACLQADDECTTDADCKSGDGLICYQGYQETKRTCSPPPV